MMRFKCPDGSAEHDTLNLEIDEFIGSGVEAMNEN